VRHTPSVPSAQALKVILDPRRLLRWIYIGRMTIASAIFVAAVLKWMDVDQTTTLLSSLAFALSTVVTVVSAGYGTVYRRPLSTTFLYLQFLWDLILVTTVVHVTGPAGTGDPTGFSALYILVIATAALLLPERSSLLIAALGIVMYAGDVWFFQPALRGEPWLWLQLVLFTVVALGIAALSERLRSSREVSELRAAQLEDVRLRADDILRNIHSGVITIDRAGRLIYANPVAEQILGLSLMSQGGSVVLDQLRRQSPGLADALERSARDRTRATRVEGTLRNGTREFPIGVTTTYMEDAAGNLSATAIFQDISDSKRMETLRVRAERLEGIAELSASLAHEIKNPLASIRSSVEQLSRLPHPGEDERALSALVMRESDRLSRLLTEFLDFARVRVARRDPVDIGDLVRGAARLAAAHPDRREGVEVVCELPGPESVIIPGDEDMLHRAVFNLALNAVQASPAGSVVTIDVRPELDDSFSGGSPFEHGGIAIRVSDQGGGIPEEIRSRLFDPFTTTKPQGTGLGLAVVQRAIEAHKGLVLLESDHTGTRVTIVLPRSTADQPVYA
jgi:two-component system sensor histidine kinase PilS (NtrC family)